MNRTRCLLLLSSLLTLGLTACERSADKGTVPAPAGSAEAAGGLVAVIADPQVETTLRSCMDKQDVTLRACLLQTLKTAGASPQALAAAEQVSVDEQAGYVSAWKSEAGIGVATATYPFRANTNQSTWLVDADGRWIDVDNDPSWAEAVEDARFKGFFAKHAEPESTLRAVDSAGLHGASSRPDGSIVTYSRPLSTCEACEPVGNIIVEFRFDAGGHYQRSEIVSVQ